MLKAHRFAEVFPLLEGVGFAGLVEDIRKHGQKDAVVLYQGLVLDGRNRCRACDVIGLEPETTTFVGTDDEALALVVSSNLHRRHLDASQYAMAAARTASMRQGARTDLAEISAMSQSDAAALFNVSRGSVQLATRVIERGIPELVRAVETGGVAVSAAAAVARLPPDEQRAVVAKGAVAVKDLARNQRGRVADLNAELQKTQFELTSPARKLSEAMAGSAPHAASLTDPDPDEEDDVVLNDDEEDDHPIPGPMHGWAPPLETSLASNDAVFAAGELAAMVARWRAELTAKVSAISPGTREAVLKRTESHFVSLVADVLDRLPWLKGAEQARASLQLIRGGRS